jgi:MOSC domain-containing protein YiiM
VCVYPDEHYPFWHRTLTEVQLPHGAFGENFTTQGLQETEVCIGDRYQLGGAVVEVSQPREPCWKLARRWRVKHLTALVEQTGLTGFYFRVLQHGQVAQGDSFILLERPFPEWTLARCNQLRHHDKHNHAAALALAACPLLSAVWKDALWARSRQEV